MESLENSFLLVESFIDYSKENHLFDVDMFKEKQKLFQLLEMMSQKIDVKGSKQLRLRLVKILESTLEKEETYLHCINR